MAAQYSTTDPSDSSVMHAKFENHFRLEGRARVYGRSSGSALEERTRSLGNHHHMLTFFLWKKRPQFQYQNSIPYSYEGKEGHVFRIGNPWRVNLQHVPSVVDVDQVLCVKREEHIRCNSWRIITLSAAGDVRYSNFQLSSICSCKSQTFPGSVFCKSENSWGIYVDLISFQWWSTAPLHPPAHTLIPLPGYALPTLDNKMTRCGRMGLFNEIHSRNGVKWMLHHDKWRAKLMLLVSQFCFVVFNTPWKSYRMYEISAMVRHTSVHTTPALQRCGKYLGCICCSQKSKRL